ncbi:hypothetical protein [Massilia sp. Dwa41.01b]|uniref:hypothetical protein n=1 Tax=Massilia sp. Dwa41.01b TaxID=2709302 RepID=UPI0028056989|nr:hypothetical protein [Massilia sp. Dwa41.01b]
MQPADSLRRRIVVAFISFGLVLSLFFAAIAIVAVEGIEVHLVDNRLAEVAQWALPREAAGLAVDLPAGLRFHRGNAIPARCAACRQAWPRSTSTGSACTCSAVAMHGARMSSSTTRAITKRSSWSYMRCSPSASSASCCWPRRSAAILRGGW